MSGKTDESDERVGIANFQTILNFSQLHHLGRLSFWSVNRDRPCDEANGGADSCSGISQQPYEFSELLAQYHG